MTQSATSIDEPLLPALTGKIAKPSLKLAWILAVIAAVLLILTVILWQIVAAHGTQDPNDQSLKLSHTAVIIDSGILVFREGLEAILVLAALTASLIRTQKGYWKPVALGAGLSFLASVATWFIAVAIIDSINAPALKIQAATGLLAIVVLLIIMNWFFHKVYWTGWITHHNRRKDSLTQSAGRTGNAIFGGLLLIGFTSVYREGFEVVLFLQDMRLKAGSFVVLEGVVIGLSLTAIVALLTFVAHYRLPYKRMLVLTGILLGAVLLVMVGEQAQEMQLAGWLPSHDLNFPIPDWAGTWFSIFPNLESLLAQFLAATFVIGSYYLARRVCRRTPKPTPGSATPANCILPDCNNCSLPHDHQDPPQNLTQLTTTKK